MKTKRLNLRTALNLKQSDFATFLGVDRTALAHLESGRRTLNGNVFKRYYDIQDLLRTKKSDSPKLTHVPADVKDYREKLNFQLSRYTIMFERNKRQLKALTTKHDRCLSAMETLTWLQENQHLLDEEYKGIIRMGILTNQKMLKSCGLEKQLRHQLIMASCEGAITKLSALIAECENLRFINSLDKESQ